MSGVPPMPGARILAALLVVRTWAGTSGPSGSTGRATDPVPPWREAVMRVPVSAAERGECLAGMHAGALSAAVGTASRRLAVSVWYRYQPGGLLTVLTGRRSRTAAA